MVRESFSRRVRTRLRMISKRISIGCYVWVFDSVMEFDRAGIYHS